MNTFDLILLLYIAYRVAEITENVVKYYIEKKKSTVIRDKLRKDYLEKFQKAREKTDYDISPETETITPEPARPIKDESHMLMGTGLYAGSNLNSWEHSMCNALEARLLKETMKKKHIVNKDKYIDYDDVTDRQITNGEL